jgi:hypothetical protein
MNSFPYPSIGLWAISGKETLLTSPVDENLTYPRDCYLALEKH